MTCRWKVADPAVLAVFPAEEEEEEQQQQQEEQQEEEDDESVAEERRREGGGQQPRSEFSCGQASGLHQRGWQPCSDAKPCSTTSVVAAAGTQSEDLQKWIRTTLIKAARGIGFEEDDGMRAAFGAVMDVLVVGLLPAGAHPTSMVGVQHLAAGSGCAHYLARIDDAELGRAAKQVLAVGIGALQQHRQEREQEQTDERTAHGNDASSPPAPTSSNSGGAVRPSVVTFGRCRAAVTLGGEGGDRAALGRQALAVAAGKTASQCGQARGGGSGGFRGGSWNPVRSPAGSLQSEAAASAVATLAAAVARTGGVARGRRTQIGAISANPLTAGLGSLLQRGQAGALAGGGALCHCGPAGCCCAGPAGNIGAPASEGQYFGNVARYFSDKGFGFIVCPQTKLLFGQDVYVHKNEIEGHGIQIGHFVSFKVHSNDKGQPQANSVASAQPLPDKSSSRP